MSFSDFDRALLTAGKKDSPSAERRRAARAAVIGAASVSALAATAAATTAETGASATATGAAGGAKTFTLGKLVFIGLALIGAAAGALSLTANTSPVTAPAPTRPALAGSTRSEPALSSPATPPQTPVPLIDVHAMPSAPATVASAPGLREDPLAVEARLLEGARACLATGDRTCARAKLAEHSARFPHGALTVEATLLSRKLSSEDAR